MTLALNLDITDRCNNRCSFCSTRGQIEFMDFERIWRKLLWAQESGFGRIDLAGGEPTLHPQILDIVSQARRLGFHTIYIKTNGRRLADGGFLAKLLAAGANNFMVSLHGPNAGIHDAHTGVEGSFAEALAGICNLAATGVGFGTLTVITRGNYLQLAQVVDLVASRGVESHSFAFSYPTAAAYQDFEAVVPTYREVLPYLQAALDRIEAHHLTFSTVDNVPLCLLAGREAYSNHMYMHSSCHPPHDWGPRCPECMYRPICDGLPKPYARARGWEEFEPISRPMGTEPRYRILVDPTFIPVPVGSLVEKPYGAVLQDAGLWPLTLKGRDVIRALDGSLTLARLQETWGSPSLSFVASLFMRKAVRLVKFDHNAAPIPGSATLPNPARPDYNSEDRTNPGGYEYPLMATPRAYPEVEFFQPPRENVVEVECLKEASVIP